MPTMYENLDMADLARLKNSKAEFDRERAAEAAAKAAKRAERKAAESPRAKRREQHRKNVIMAAGEKHGKAWAYKASYPALLKVARSNAVHATPGSFVQHCQELGIGLPLRNIFKSDADKDLFAWGAVKAATEFYHDAKRQGII
ncbi:MAG TPA: hypothetical protein VNT79_09945 [Phycisphaerae bacterium]|nr:hypothetical protein [Phycisphaerae bacterium]